MRHLTEQDINNLKTDQNSKNLYLEAMKAGADVILLNETDEGYDIGMSFSGKEPIH